MTLASVLEVADAVLYEGYLLYPYRSTSAKNQVRWQFGVLGPPEAAAAGAGEDPTLATECLVRPAGADPRVTVHLRFLQLQARVVEVADDASPGGWRPVPEADAGGRTLVTWDEAVPQHVELGTWTAGALRSPLEVPVAAPGGEDVEPVAGASTRVVRRRWPLKATVRLSVAIAASGVERLSVEVANAAAWDGDGRTGATRVSLLGAHLVLEAADASFVSLLEPPEGLAEAAAACAHHRCWPVLAGEEGTDDRMLVSPIILYDHPAVAPESAGALFDSTEIDEILTLRVMTMTDTEKAEARATDPAAAAIIDRCDAMSPEEMARLHGTLRDPHAGAVAPATVGDEAEVPWWDPEADAGVAPGTDTVLVEGVAVGRGSAVRLHPSRRADAQDLFYDGRRATVTAVLSDVDGGTHVAVVVDDDPAADLHEWYGRYLYFSPDEIEPLVAGGGNGAAPRSQQAARHEEDA